MHTAVPSSLTLHDWNRYSSIAHVSLHEALRVAGGALGDADGDGDGEQEEPAVIWGGDTDGEGVGTAHGPYHVEPGLRLVNTSPPLQFHSGCGITDTYDPEPPAMEQGRSTSHDTDSVGMAVRTEDQPVDCGAVTDTVPNTTVCTPLPAAAMGTDVNVDAPSVYIAALVASIVACTCKPVARSPPQVTVYDE